MEVRAEKAEDLEAISQVNIAAFGRKSEANLVEQLRGVSSKLLDIFFSVQLGLQGNVLMICWL
jgi:predicted N-acetyltransferase YhbS